MKLQIVAIVERGAARSRSEAPWKDYGGKECRLVADTLKSPREAQILETTLPPSSRSLGQVGQFVIFAQIKTSRSSGGFGRSGLQRG